MIRYHPTNGDRGELCVDWDGAFVGFVVRHAATRWSAYTRRLEPIGEHYSSRAAAATACYHRSHGEPRILIDDILACTAAT